MPLHNISYLDCKECKIFSKKFISENSMNIKIVRLKFSVDVKVVDVPSNQAIDSTYLVCKQC